MLRSVLLTLVFAHIALAVPAVGPELPVDPTLGAEPINAFQFAVRLDALTDGYALSWTDNRSGIDGTWLTLFDADGGVLVPGTRALATAYDFNAQGNRAMCPLANGDLLWLVKEAWSDEVSVITTRADGTRLSRSSWTAPSLTVDQAMTCPGGAPLWLTTRYSSMQGEFALELRGVSSDAGISSLDGGTIREALGVSDFEFAFGLSGNTAWWTEGGVEGLDLFAAPVSAAGVGTPQRIAGGPGHQTSAVFVGNEALWTEQVLDAGQRDIHSTFRTSPLAATPQDEDLPQLVFDGVRYLAAWRVQLAPYDYELRVAPIAVNGMYGATTTLFRGWFDHLQLASLGRGQTMVVLRDFSRGIHAVTLFLDGTVPRATPDGGLTIDPNLTALSQTRNLSTSLAPGRQLISWQQGNERLMRALGVGDAGVARLDVNLGEVRLASNGTQLLSLDFWREARVLDANTLQAGAPFTWINEPPSAIGTPAWDGTRFWVTSIVADEKRLELQAITPPSTLATPTVIASGAEDAELALTANGSMIIAWSRTREVHVTCRDAAGSMRELLTVPSTAYLPLPRIATSGEATLVTFLTELPMGLGLDALLIDRDCTVARRLSLGPTDWWSRLDSYVSTVEWDGAEFIVGWLPISNDRNGDVAITAIDETGAMRGPFVIAAVQGAPELEPSIAVEGPGRWWVSYQRFEEQESISARRGYYRLVVDDAGVRVDAGVVANDAGVVITPDAGGATSDAGGVTPDAGGMGSDAGSPDAGEQLADGGTPPTPHRSLGVGCGCSSDAGGLTLGLISLGGWLAWRRRRSSTRGPAL